MEQALLVPFGKTKGTPCRDSGNSLPNKNECPQTSKIFSYQSCEL
jgi:hypothetical protein